MDWSSNLGLVIDLRHGVSLDFTDGRVASMNARVPIQNCMLSGTIGFLGAGFTADGGIDFKLEVLSKPKIDVEIELTANLSGTAELGFAGAAVTLMTNPALPHFKGQLFLGFDFSLKNATVYLDPFCKPNLSPPSAPNHHY